MSLDLISLESLTNKIQKINSEITPYLSLLSVENIGTFGDEEREEFVRLSKLRSDYLLKIQDLFKNHYLLDIWHNNLFDDWHLSDNIDGTANERSMCINHIALIYPVINGFSTLTKSIIIDANKNLGVNSYRKKYSVSSGKFLVKSKPNFPHYFISNSIDSLNTSKSSTGYYLFCFERDKYDYKTFTKKSLEIAKELFKSNIENGFSINFSDKSKPLTFKKNNPKVTEEKIFYEFLAKVDEHSKDVTNLIENEVYPKAFSFYCEDYKNELFLNLLKNSDLNFKLNKELNSNSSKGGTSKI